MLIRVTSLLALLMLTSPAFAQQHQPNDLDKALMQQLGSLTFANTIMNVELKRLTEEINKLKAKVEELEKPDGAKK